MKFSNYYLKAAQNENTDLRTVIPFSTHHVGLSQHIQLYSLSYGK